MRNLLQLVIRFGGLLMFLFLEVICFYLIVNFNKRHNQIFLNSSNAVVGFVYKRYANTRDYFKLDEQNAQLLQDNQQLVTRVEQLESKLERLEERMRDSLPDRARENDADEWRNFDFIGAKVINNSVTANNNLLTLDKGKTAGVVRHAGVINGKGIVGVVRNASANYASVMSVLHRQSRVSVSVKDKSYFGALIWKGNHPKKVNVEAVPKHADFEKGDTIVTSGYSYLFPKGIVVGTIDTFWVPDGNNFFEIEVTLVNDLSKLEHAYICINKNREELLTLEREVND